MTRSHALGPLLPDQPATTPTNPESTVEFLAIGEVPHDKRVACQAAGCGHPVYRRIHVVRKAGQLMVLGSDCFGKLFRGTTARTPRYSATDGRPLSESERRMLLDNTESLIAQFALEHEQQREAARLQLQSLRESQAQAQALARAPVSLPRPIRVARWQVTQEELSRFTAQAKSDVRAKWRVDPDLAGWWGLVLDRVRELAQENPPAP